jgi:hypothetical protein
VSLQSQQVCHDVTEHVCLEPGPASCAAVVGEECGNQLVTEDVQRSGRHIGPQAIGPY